MVHVVEGGRSDRRPKAIDSRSRSTVAVAILVAVVMAAVLAARGVLVLEGLGGAVLWLVSGTAAGLGLLRWIRASGSSRGAAGQMSVERVSRRPDRAPAAQDARRHRRFVPTRRATTLHTRDGRQIAARIVDISIAGVAVEARLSDREFLGVARVGARKAGPVRRTPTGAVFGFDALLDPQPFDASFVL